MRNTGTIFSCNKNSARLIFRKNGKITSVLFSFNFNCFQTTKQYMEHSCVKLHMFLKLTLSYSLYLMNFFLSKNAFINMCLLNTPVSKYLHKWLTKCVFNLIIYANYFTLNIGLNYEWKFKRAFDHMLVILNKFKIHRFSPGFFLVIFFCVINCFVFPLSRSTYIMILKGF